ncbi:MAG: helix-turn-helix domain-containing protein [Planctomycetota bacterium]|jgi:hypothetical protein
MNWKLKRKIIERYGTQADFSKAANVDESIISRVIRNRKKLSKEEQKRWSKFLSCQSKDIFHIGTDK